MDEQSRNGGLGMRVQVEPSQIQGNVSIPSSKSMAHRAIICASLAQGTSVVSNISYSKDIEATIACMRALGATIEVQESSCIVTGTNLQVSGHIECDCNESGSTLRFLIPIAACTKTEVEFIGHGRLMQRPMDVYQEIFDAQNLPFKQDDTIQMIGPLQPGTYQVQGDISSQFISGLLFALPLLDGDSTISITEPYESKSYVDLTLQMLKTFGVNIIEKDSHTYVVPGNQVYRAHDVSVEGDYSQMAFFAVLASLQNALTIYNMDPNSLQGDKVIVDQIRQAGAYIEYEDGIHISSKHLHGQTIDLANCPDLGPILCVLASFITEETKIIHARRLRMKESDRIEAMEQELRKWGVDITSTEDTITIHGKNTYSMDEVVQIHGHNDHRIVMAMTVFGLCAQSPSIIDDAQAITKSYPKFFEDIQNIQGKVTIL